jgi:phage I-like protein
MNPLLQPLLNREGTLPDDGWYHLVPLGEFPHSESGRVQVIDQAAITAMLNRFNDEARRPNFAGLLIDQEHWSYDSDKSSESFGWVKELANRADGLWGRIEFSDLGEQAVKNRRYKFVSPVFWPAKDIQKLDGQKVRPLRIDSFGLTNSPNFKGMVPFTNRAGADAPAEDQNQPPKHSMKQVAQRLGLSADASEDSILAAVDKLANRATSAETQATDLGKEVGELKNRNAEMLNDQVADELDAAGITEETKRTKLTPVLKSMKNRAERVDFLKECVASDKQDDTKSGDRPVFNRADTKTPKNPTAPDEKSRADQQHAAIEEIRLVNRCTYEQAQGLAIARKPELFGQKK